MPEVINSADQPIQAVQPVVRGRFAPSPTGDLHLGNLRTALLAWLFTRCASGHFVLRIEDLDQPRVRPGSTVRILADLRWLGLDWDEGPDCGGPYAPYTQSERLHIYQHYLKQLQDAGLVYPCYCTRAEIAQAASDPQQGAEDGPRYPETCRNLSASDRRRYEANGRQPSLRFRVPAASLVTFNDLLVGEYTTQHVHSVVGDFIVQRSDGIFAYQFAVVIDDALMHINQVVRGTDLLSSTARQILLYEALGFPVPTFAHVPLVLDEQGHRLAKRQQSMGLAPLKEAGKSPQAIITELAASCGLTDKDYPISPKELVRQYSPSMYDIISAKTHG
ncbi:MAG: tRNA glutamyl-Q(34) synthetase GluQRS [Ktedonobacteraceae bacterium]|nr:tRNA glutamyl-Q(34) synthetase GluQRS [Ktedonobacteraceae bacterium]